MVRKLSTCLEILDVWSKNLNLQLWSGMTFRHKWCPKFNVCCVVRVLLQVNFIFLFQNNKTLESIITVSTTEWKFNIVALIFRSPIVTFECYIIGYVVDRKDTKKTITILPKFPYKKFFYFHKNSYSRAMFSVITNG